MSAYQGFNSIAESNLDTDRTVMDRRSLLYFL